MKMKFSLVLLVLTFVAPFSQASKFFGYNNWIILGNDKADTTHRPGLTQTVHGSVTVDKAAKVEYCLPTWKFGSDGYLKFTQDGSLNLNGKSLTIATFIYYPKGGWPVLRSPTVFTWDRSTEAGKPNGYLSTFGTKMGDTYYSFKKTSLKDDTWVFFGTSYDKTTGKTWGWVNEEVTAKESKYTSFTSNYGVGVNKFSTSLPAECQLAGMIVLEGAVTDMSQVATLKKDLLGTFCKPSIVTCDPAVEGGKLVCTCAVGSGDIPDGSNVIWKFDSKTVTGTGTHQNKYEKSSVTVAADHNKDVQCAYGPSTLSTPAKSVVEALLSPTIACTPAPAKIGVETSCTCTKGSGQTFTPTHYTLVVGETDQTPSTSNPLKYEPKDEDKDKKLKCKVTFAGPVTSPASATGVDIKFDKVCGAAEVRVSLIIMGLILLVTTIFLKE